MQVTIAQQIFIFLTAVLCGVSIGILFDIFRIIRKLSNPTKASVNIQDTLFWLASAILVFWYIFTFNKGELRWFIFVGVFLSGWLYNLTISKYFIKIGIFLVNLLKKASIFLLKVILLPIAFIYRLIRKPLIFVFNATGRGARRWSRMRKDIFGRFSQSLQNFYKIYKKI